MRKVRSTSSLSGASGSGIPLSRAASTSLLSTGGVGGHKKTPFEMAQPFVCIEVAKRRIVRKAVASNRPVQVIQDSRLGFFASERGLEWDRQAKAMPPKEKPPSLQHLLLLCEEDFDLSAARASLEDARHARQPRRSSVFSGYGLQRGVPRLPIRRKCQEKLPPEAAALDVVESDEEETPVANERREVSVVSIRLGSKALALNAGGATAPAEEVDEDEMPFPWCEDEMRSVFGKFDLDKDGEIDKEELGPALKYLGARPPPDVVRRVAMEQTTYATLNWEEYVEFLHRYRDYDVDEMRKVFRAADVDGEGTLELSEFHKLLHDSGYKITKAVVKEAMGILDANNDGKVSFREFEGLREHLRQTEGFCMADVAELTSLYESTFKEKKGSDGGGELVADETWRVSMYIGYCATLQDIERMSAQVDADSSGVITFIEMLKILRMVRDEESDNMAAALRKRGEDPNHLKVEDLGIALTDMGYFVSEEAVYEILDELGDTENENTLTFEELSDVLRSYRRVEGFTEAEREDFKQVFDKEDRGENALSTIEIGRLLRWYGIATTVQQVQGLVEEVDLDCSGKLEFPEMLKLLRCCFQADSKKRHKAFDLMDINDKGEIHRDRFEDALRLFQDSPPDPELLKQAVEATKYVDESFTGTKGFVDRSGFEVFYKEYRKLVVDKVRANGGYNSSEVTQLLQIFNEYDKDKSGSIEKAELQKLIAAFFPEATKSKEGQQEIARLLAEIDTDGNVELEFREFLWLMRKCDDMRDAADMAEESKVMKDCGLTQEEVDGYRQIFSKHVDWTGKIGLDALTKLITAAIDLTPFQLEALGHLACEVNPENKPEARFPQFLRLIKNLTENRALGLNEAATRVVRRDEKFKSATQRRSSP